jgi:hypothetical protein
MPIKFDLTGRIFGRLKVLNFVNSEKYTKWRCVCECSNELTVLANNLKRGTTKSCGCLQKESASKVNKVHGLKNTPEYRAWINMKNRCYNQHDKRYSDWGGRGIKVCDRWLHSFESFLSDMGKKPTRLHSLDRHPDINGNYEPGNCRWATMPQQNRGKRNNIWLEHNGIKKILSDWAKEFNVNKNTLTEHLITKSFEEVFSFYTNKKNGPLLTSHQIIDIKRRAYLGEKQNKLSIEFNVSHSTINQVVNNKGIYKNTP